MQFAVDLMGAHITHLLSLDLQTSSATCISDVIKSLPFRQTAIYGEVSGHFFLNETATLAFANKRKTVAVVCTHTFVAVQLIVVKLRALVEQRIILSLP